MPRLDPRDPWMCAQAKMWQAFELARAKEYRPLMYLRVIGPLDRRRPKGEVMREVRRSTSDPAHSDWVSRVYDGTVINEAEAALLAGQLYQRLDYIERALQDDFPLVEQFTIEDISVYPRVAMYPLVGLPIAAVEYPRTSCWLATVARAVSIETQRTRTPRLGGKCATDQIADGSRQHKICGSYLPGAGADSGDGPAYRQFL